MWQHAQGNLPTGVLRKVAFPRGVWLALPPRAGLPGTAVCAGSPRRDTTQPSGISQPIQSLTDVPSIISRGQTATATYHYDPYGFEDVVRIEQTLSTRPPASVPRPDVADPN